MVSEDDEQREEHVDEPARIGDEAPVFVATGCKLCEQPGADPGRPQHERHPHSKYEPAAPRQEEGDRGEDDHGQHAVTDEADAPVEIEVPAAAA